MKGYILIASIFGIVFSACNKEVKESVSEFQNTALVVCPDFSDTPTRASLMQNFVVGDEIGLYIRDERGYAYGGIPSNFNVKSTKTASAWVQIPIVYLSNENARVYAYYPYSANFSQMLEMKAETQTDYLFGTHSSGQSAINNSNPVVRLTMQHLMSLIQFKMCKQSYPGAGVVTKIEVANSSSCSNKRFYSEANWDVINTSLTYEEKNDPVILENNSGLYTLTTNFPASFISVLVVPMEEETVSAGDLIFRFTIDGKVYTYDLPAGTIWEMATKNIYTITLTGRGLEIGNVVIEDWKAGQTGSSVLQ